MRISVWWKMALGGAVGLAVGSLTEPGYAMWILLGVVTGYLWDIWGKKEGTGPPTGRGGRGAGA